MTIIFVFRNISNSFLPLQNHHTGAQKPVPGMVTVTNNTENYLIALKETQFKLKGCLNLF
jgi:hypothetical protein